MEKASAFVMLKPLGQQEIVKPEIFSMLKTIADIPIQRIVVISHKIIRQQYEDAENLPHFYPITSYLTNKKVEIMILEGDGTHEKFISELKNLVGKSDPAKCQEGQIRHLAIKHNLPYIVPIEPKNGSNNYCFDNLIHCSDSYQATQKEIKLWFQDLNSYK